MSNHFTNLHLHTDFSLLDGAISFDRLIEFAKKNDFKALAKTDHGNVFGGVQFFQQCKKAKIKPILGIEAYLTEDVRLKIVDNKYYHIILLVQNKQGYKNLCKLIAYSYQEGFYFKPRIDYAILAKYSEGLIATSGCLGGHIPQLLSTNQHALVDERVDWFLNTFGRDRFFLEVQPEDQKEQKLVNQKLFELSARTNIACVATSDAHYVLPEDRESHEIMLAVQTHDTIDNPKRYTFGDCRVHIRTTQEMLDIFPNNPEVVWQAGIIADQCNFDFETGKLFFPQFPIPQEHTPESYFSILCNQGLDRLVHEGFIPLPQINDYQRRLNVEVDLITKMGFVGYFLVVSDFIQWAYKQGIPVGPGRGSAAGSVVAWALQITNIDPIKYNLLFERFLNPERASMPDIDIDFCIEGRDTVINYVREKYGHNKVCNIITFGTMMAKGVLKDVARVLGMTFEDANMLSNLIPEQLKITLAQAVEQEPRLQELIEQNPKIHKLFELAYKLEGLTRHASKHAAGIVISPEPVDEVLPLYIPSKTTDLVAQYDMTELEIIGFLKIDFLGLKNLTLIDRVVKAVKKQLDITININRIPLDDKATFALLGAGKTSGVFQLESDGLKEVLRKLQPDKFEDIIAVNALYRPGPLGSGMVDDYIERRHGRQSIKYIFQELAPILAETYGVIVYQEQVIKIASTIAGYSLGEADILRRAMGKKKAEVMAEQRELFFKRAQERKFDSKKAGELFDLMAYFAGYGFNKSHSAAYALIAYQTAYLKTHYPAYFMSCLISLEADHPEKMATYLQEAKDMHLGLLAPDINHSAIDFSVVDKKILFGLRGIKNIGSAALDNIIHAREKELFKDLFDFCKRVDLRTANKRVIESLVTAGAFDHLPGNRAQNFNEIAHIIELALAYKKDSATGQMGLFSGSPQSVGQDTTSNYSTSYAFQPLPDWPIKEKLEREKEALGFYMSAHPLDTYKKQLSWFSTSSFAEIISRAQQHRGEQELLILCCGLIKQKKEIVTKKGDRMAFVQMEGYEGTAEVILFPKVFSKVSQWLSSHDIFLIKGYVDLSSTHNCKIKAIECVPLELVLSNWSKFPVINCHLPEYITKQLLDEIALLMTPGPSSLNFIYQEQNNILCLATKKKIVVNALLIELLEQHNISITLEL